MKPIIGIVSRPSKIFNTIDSQVVEETNRNMILKFGGIPIMIMPPQVLSYDSTAPKDTPSLTTFEEEILVDELKLCDGILMPGGLKSYSYDYFIDDYAKENNIPILGECLGMQIMARNHGGARVIKNETDIKHYNKDTMQAHKVFFVDDSKLSKMVNKKCETVNSFHNYHVCDVKNMKISAYASDGIIEAVEDPTKLFRLGVQWHPEKDLDNESNQAICEGFIEAAKVYKKKRTK